MSAVEFLAGLAVVFAAAFLIGIGLAAAAMRASQRQPRRQGFNIVRKP